MSTTPLIDSTITPAINPNDQVAAAQPSSGPLHISLPSMSVDALHNIVAHIAQAFPNQPVTVSTPDSAFASDAPNLQLLPYSPSTSSQGSWVPAAADYVNAWLTARDHNPAAILILGPEAESISISTLQNLAHTALQGTDLVIPRYPVGPHEALLTSGILYPLTRALFSNPARYPLTLDCALSPRIAQRIATAAQRLTAANQGSALIWPVGEAATAGFSICDLAGDPRTLPQPSVENLNDLLATVVGSIFADCEAKAAFWQRARLTGGGHPRHLADFAGPSQPDTNPIDLAPMLEGFRNAYSNLRELWSLVLPPNSLLQLKKLSLAPTQDFTLPDDLWARTVYDFLLAYRLRTINRGHLLGAFSPLYLAWVASHIHQVGNDPASAERHIETVAAAFENDKPYLVSRWRWPDRFNP